MALEQETANSTNGTADIQHTKNFYLQNIPFDI
jgi:hypothetical protein